MQESSSQLVADNHDKKVGGRIQPRLRSNTHKVTVLKEKQIVSDYIGNGIVTFYTSFEKNMGINQSVHFLHGSKIRNSSYFSTF